MADPDQSNPDPKQDPRNPFAGGFSGFPGANPHHAERARRVYVRFNERVSTIRRQPSWAQKLVGYTILILLLGLFALVAIAALILGLIIAIPLLLLITIARLINAITGKKPTTNAGPNATGRANVRVISRRN